MPQSSHVPYRDSKLTRILQESLGGNSRTTLIINSSPSSYNEAESISTLRFGARAKTIKNKAKVNADLSPAELKALLKRVKGDAVSFKAYIAALENEIGIWRSGKKVSETSWASPNGKQKVASGGGDAPITPPQTPAPAFKLSTTSDDDASRPSTPAMVLGKDEKDEFLKREQDLLEQINEQVTALSNREKQINEIQEMLEELKDKEKTCGNSNKALSSELSEAQVQLEKEFYEKKEGEINIDSLKEANLEYTAELDELKATLQRLQVAEAKNTEELKVAETVIENAQVKEKEIESDLLNVQDITPEAIQKLRQDLQATKAMIEQHKVTVDNLEQERDSLVVKRDDLEIRFANLEVDYEELLDKTIAMEEMDVKQTSDIADSIADLKTKLESQFIMKSQVLEKEIESLKSDMLKKSKEENRLMGLMKALEETQEKLLKVKAQPVVADTKEAVEQKEKELEKMRKSMAQELADFETMKKVLMRDLQSRCEKVVELEFQLDETRIQQNNLLKATSSKAQQKKMSLLERNLDQLTNVQKQVSVINGLIYFSCI